MAATVNEISRSAVGARIEKVFQPSKESVLLVLRGCRGENGKGTDLKLLIDAGAANPRLSFADPVFENPKVPPNFCMLLRKHINGGKITSVRQLGFERAAEIEIEARDEMGFLSKKYIYAEIMGKFSNLIFCDADKKVIGAVRVNDLSGGSKRPILPGITYSAPPPQEGKISPLDETKEGFFSALADYDGAPSKFIMSRYCGIAPLVAREISFTAGDSAEKLWENFSALTDRIKNLDFTPVMVKNPDGTPLEYSFMPITQYENSGSTKIYDSFSELTESFFAERTRNERIRQRAADVLHLLTNAETRLNKKIAAQREDLTACAEKETLKLYGDLITANIYMLKRGMTEAALPDYSSENCPTVTVPLDGRLTPAQNAQRYYKKYAKCKSAEINLAKQIELAENELSYIDTVFDSLTRAETEADLNEIRRELFVSGYASRMKNYKETKIPAPKPMEFTTTNGYKVMCGKNNSQNDYLTHKLASKNDIWFHIRDYPGSHAVMFCGDDDPPAEDFTDAAVIAATYSKAPAGQRVTVDYTRVKNIKKPPNAKPGFVTFSSNYSAYVVPSPERAEKLRRK